MSNLGEPADSEPGLVQPRLAVVVVGYREGVLLSRAIDSALAQQGRGVEVIVVKSHSDCAASNDACRQAQERGCQVLWLRQNRGLSFARNAGVAIARADWVCFLDGDDELPEGAILRYLDGMSKYAYAGFLFGDYEIRDIVSGEFTTYNAGQYACGGGRLNARKAISEWMLSGHGAVRRDLYRRLGGLRQRFSFGYQDVDFYFRMLTSGVEGGFVGGPVYRWHRSAAGMNERRSGAWQYYRACSWRAYEIVGGDPLAYERGIDPFLSSTESWAAIDSSKAFWLLVSMFPARLKHIRPFVALIRRMVCRAVGWWR